MRFIALIAALLSAPAFADWTEGATIGVRTDNARTPTAIFANTYTGIGAAGEGVWLRVAVADLGIPPDAKAVFLSGILIITHGVTPQTCDLTISVRAHGDSMHEGFYIGQVIEASVGNGQRSTMSTWAPVRDGYFEYFWKRNTAGQWPSECAYAINLAAQAYVR